MNGDGVVRMTDETKTLLEVAGIAGMGGLVNYIRHPHNGNGKFRAAELAACILSAAYAGVIAHFIVAWLELGTNLQFAVAGIAGYGGGVFLDMAVGILKQMMQHRAGVGHEEKKPR